MIIINKNDTSYFITNSEHPNEDWTKTVDNPDGEAAFICDDNSELAQKIIKWFPKVIIEADENKNIISVSKDETVTEEDIQAAISVKKKEISEACNITITGGIEINGEHYSLTIEDQANIIAWMAVTQHGQSVPYHSDGNPCRIYSAEEFTSLANAVVQFKTIQTTYCNLLMRQVEEMSDIDEINAVEYGKTQLNERYTAIMESIVSTG